MSLTHDDAIVKLRELGWCCTAAHPYSAFKHYQAGIRDTETEAYGPFPGGRVKVVYGTGDTFLEAVERALAKLEADLK